MQGVAVLDRELLDAESLVRHLVPAGSVFAFLADHRRVLFPDGLFADLFTSANGPAERARGCGRVGDRAAEPAGFVGSGGDRGVALRSAVEGGVWAGVDRRADSTRPRSRIGGAGWPRRRHRTGSSTRSVQVVAETGVLRGKTRRALDSTILDDAVATQDTVTQLIAAIRRVAREVPGAAEVVTAECGARLHRPGQAADRLGRRRRPRRLVDALVADA